MIIVHITDNHGHRVQPRQFTGAFAAVSGHQLIAASLAGAGNGRLEDAILFDAFHGLSHGIIVFDRKGMIGKRVQLRKRNMLQPPQRGVLTFLLCGEQVRG